MFNKIIKAKKLINQHIINTPSGLSHALSELTGRSIFVKYENKQHTGSFKFRGSLNKLLSLKEGFRFKNFKVTFITNYA